MEEIWKCIIDYEGLYKISNLGRLASLKSGKFRILSNKNSKGDYLRIRLIRGNHIKSFEIHRLVYMTFKGSIPKGFQVHHIDGNKQNNKIDNLIAIDTKTHAYITQNQNPKMTYKMVNYNKFIRPHKIMQFNMDGTFIREFINAIEASKITGICSRNILQVANKNEYKPGKYRKQAGGYIWRVKP
jgi:hypothetical protein